tara:strand:- start:177 stop:863 length:687 start_codon:yes stop_codon:yes gene_type:complete
MKLGIGLGNAKVSSGVFSPSDSSNLELWYKNGVGNATTGWTDSASGATHTGLAPFGHEAVQVSGGGVELSSANGGDYFDFTQIEISGTFTMLWVIEMSAYTSQNTIFSANQSNWIEHQTEGQVRLKLGNASNVLQFTNSGHFATGEKYIITLSRDSSGLFTMHKNGDLLSQTSSQTNTLDFIIDTLGIRNDNDRAFDGDIYEVLVYSTEKTGTDLQNIHSYLTTKFSL